MEMSLHRTIMLFGLGDLGGWVLEILARQQGINTIITCDARAKWGALKTHSAACGAGHMGYSKTIIFEQCDVSNIDRTAQLLSTYKPDLIYNSMGLLSPQLPGLLPPEIFKKTHKIVGGPLLIPPNIPLITKLMKSVKESGIAAPVVNNSWPDIVNGMLWKKGLGPLVGSGNIDIRVANIRRRISLEKNIPIPQITVYIVGGHALGIQGAKAGVPYYIKVMVGDKDITNEYDTDSLVSDNVLSGFSPTEASWIVRPTVASCACRIIMAILNDTHELTHAPGPNGLPGGYPIRVRAKGVEVDLPRSLTLEEAIKINLGSMRCEGAQEIREDGTLVITDEAYQITKELLGIGVKEVTVEDAEDLAKEVIGAYKKLCQKYNVASALPTNPS